MGPLHGVRIVELAGIGPAPYAAMLLADLGATIIRIDRPEPASLGIERPQKFNLVLRNRQIVTLDLKRSESRDLVLALVEKSDGFIEGFRPGVTEKLGLGPQDCLARNPRLVYGRMTGWGQDGPLSSAAGHDLNYIALTGVLSWIGKKGEPPTVPLNLVGDYAGGGAYLALGMLAAMMHARTSGQGQVVDAAIVDGTASLATSMFGMQAAGMLGARGENILDGGAPYYNVYQCKDNKYISIAPIEGKFFDQFCQLAQIDPNLIGNREDRQHWPSITEELAEIFRQRTRDQWCELLEGTDACFAPVLDPQEAAEHPHLKSRGTFVEVDGVTQPAAAPRFSVTQPETPKPVQQPDEDSLRVALDDWLGKELSQVWQARLKG